MQKKIHIVIDLSQVFVCFCVNHDMKNGDPHQ